MTTTAFGLPVWLTLSWLIGWVSPPQHGNVYAVVVGISDYKALTFFSGDLRYADQDARRFVRFLESSAGGRVPKAHIRLLQNNQATRQNILEALTLFEQARSGDRIIFYFSGHGKPDNFVPYDAQPSQTGSWLAHAQIKRAFRQSGASTKLCIADACYAGSMTNQQTSRLATKKSDTQHTEYPTNTALILATRATQLAAENSQMHGGVFTHFLLSALQGKADSNTDRVVTIKELYTYVSLRMHQATARSGRNQGQKPVFYGRFTDNLPLAYL